MATKFDGEDYIDSRDVIGRIEYLEGIEDTEGYGEDDAQELDELRTFAEDAGNSEWTYGQQFIRDSYFEEFAQELAEEIGAIPDDASWPATCIDWEQAARELQMDYVSAELNGVTYWTR
jgi:hypothetical protein